jgi:hypothetical protein
MALHPLYNTLWSDVNSEPLNKCLHRVAFNGIIEDYLLKGKIKDRKIKFSFCFDIQSKLYLNFYSHSSSEHSVIKPSLGDSSGSLSRSRGEEVILWRRMFHCSHIYL